MSVWIRWRLDRASEVLRAPSTFGVRPWEASTRHVCERKWLQRKGVDTKNLPFLVYRTPSGNLPVYHLPTLKGETVTRVGKVFGDAEHLAAEIGRLCSTKARVHTSSRKSVQLKGDHVVKIKGWLQNLGL